MRSALPALALVAALTASAHAACLPADRDASIGEIVERVRSENLEYVFVGEQHAVGPVKRFAVDLANALSDAGEDVGLYVEGFRTDCRVLGDRACTSLARVFNEPAFLTLLAESRAAVRARSVSPAPRHCCASCQDVAPNVSRSSVAKCVAASACN